MRFLFRWQHLAPGTQLHGADGVLQIVIELQGYEISAAAWEADVLRRRIAGYKPEWLDELCLAGDVMWGRLSPHPALDPSRHAPRRVRPTRIAPVSLFQRAEAAWLLERAGTNGGDVAPDEAALSHSARDLLEALRRRGASFLPDLVRATGRLTSEVEDGLWELLAAGVVTADGFDNLRALRWGVVFRDLLARETLAPPWRELLGALRRLEARGEIRGGRFVEGFVGEQFARPEAIELLRLVRRQQTPGDGIEVSAADPLNLAGIITPGPRVSALSGDRVAVLQPSGDRRAEVRDAPVSRMPGEATVAPAPWR